MAGSLLTDVDDEDRKGSFLDGLPHSYRRILTSIERHGATDLRDPNPSRRLPFMDFTNGQRLDSRDGVGDIAEDFVIVGRATSVDILYLGELMAIHSAIDSA